MQYIVNDFQLYPIACKYYVKQDGFYIFAIYTRVYIFQPKN